MFFLEIPKFGYVQRSAAVKGTPDVVRPKPDTTLGQEVACYYTCVFYRFGKAEAGILEFVGRESLDIPGSPRRRTG
jgi:hypothetical protein